MPDANCALLLVPNGVMIDGKSYREGDVRTAARRQQRSMDGNAHGYGRSRVYPWHRKAVDIACRDTVLASALKGRDTLYVPTFPHRT